MVLTHVVNASLSGSSLHHVLRQMDIGVEQTARILSSNSVRVDGEFVYPNQPVFEGETIEISLPGFESRESVPLGYLQVPEILFEDEAYLAVFKPSGVQTHPSKTARMSLEDSMEERVISSLRCNARPFHRLDAETQGILLFTKNPYAQAALQKELLKGRFHKQYEAYVYGTLPTRSGILDAPIERKHRGSYTRIVRENGKPSTTSYSVLDIQQIDGVPISHVLLSPLTGRTHQLRVHMHYLHCPIIGDHRYRTPASTAFQEDHYIPTLLLNAFRLTFYHPFLKEDIRLSSPALQNPFWYLHGRKNNNVPSLDPSDSSLRFLW